MCSVNVSGRGGVKKSIDQLIWIFGNRMKFWKSETFCSCPQTSKQATNQPNAQTP